MSTQSFRFLHCGKFHLESTLRGIVEAPEHLAEELSDAPFASAERVFTAAIKEEVDFVVISGDVLDPTAAGPRAVAFLAEQFDRLDSRGIAIYWAASELDLRGEWLTNLEWPDNVNIFGTDSVQQLTHECGDVAVATILGRSWHVKQSWRPAEFTGIATTGFQVAVLQRASDLGTDTHRGIEYWAIGGEQERSTRSTSDGFIHCPGGPQGFSPDETGAHGCTLVHVDADGEARLRAIETDTVRWHREHVEVPSSVSRNEIHNALKSRIAAITEEHQRTTLIEWRLTGLGRFESAFARGEQRAQTLEWLRREFGYGSPAAWSLSLELEAPHAVRAEWCEEDSILGDYMTAIQTYQEEDERRIDTSGVVDGCLLPDEFAANDWSRDPIERDETLRDAAILGLELLRGDDSQPREPTLSSS